jgi:acyl dehydratase
MAAKRFLVEEGHIMMFARAVGDENPIYYDHEYAKTAEPGEMIAPPTFAQASAQFDPDYALRPKIGKPWMGSGKNPSGITRSPGESGGDSNSGGGGLHAEQHFEYHRNLKVGDVLSATTQPGKTWEKQGRRAGKLKFSESVTEFRDQNGELVITARAVSVVTERPASQD